VESNAGGIYSVFLHLKAILDAAEDAYRGAWNESGEERVLMDEPIACPDALTALDHHKFASGRTLWTS
jgi:hypothetical protein